MARRIQTHDWAATPLGPLSSWSDSLRSTTDLLLACSFPMVALWGPELVQIYNDGYAEIMGGKHPGGLGQPTRDCWPEVWSFNQPIYKQVSEGETLTFEDQLFSITRHGYLENAYFTLCYSPLRDGGSSIAGVLVTVFETTQRRQAEQTLRESDIRFRALIIAGTYSIYRMSPDWRYMYQLNSHTLANTSDPIENWVDKYIPHEDRDSVFRTIEQAIRTKSLFELEHRVRLADGSIGWVLSRAVPLFDAKGEITEWFGAGSDVTDRRAATEKVRESEERQVLLLKLSDALRPLADENEIQRVATKVVGEYFSAAYANYATIEAEKGIEYYNAKHTYSAPGHPSIAGRYRFADFPSVTETLRTGRTLAVADVAAHRSLKPEDKASYDAVGVASFLMVPLVKNEHLDAIFAVSNAEPHVWTANEISLAEDVVERIGIALERARAQTILRESEEQQTFLLRLSDTLRPLTDGAEIQSATTRLLGEHLGVDRCYYFEVDHKAGEYVIHRDFKRGNLRTLAGRHPIQQWPEMTAALRRGEILVVDDYANSPSIPPEERPPTENLDIRAIVLNPLIKQGTLVACMAAVQSVPRRWTEGEVWLVSDVAERTWAGVERTRAEDALRQSEEKYRTLFETMDQGYAEIELIRDEEGRAVDHRVTLANPAYERASGVPMDKVLGRPILEVFPENDPWWTEELDRIVCSGISEHFERENPLLQRWFEVNAVPRDKNRLLLLFDNITDRKHAEQTLRDSEERFRLFVENVREYALVQTDFNGTVTSWNPGAERLFGYTSEEIVGKPFNLLLPEGDRQDGIIAREMARLSHGEHVIDAHAVQRKNGSQFWAEWITDPVLDDAGKLRGTAKVMRDETERQKVSAALESSVAEKESLLREVHHRVKNNLQVITSLLNLQSRGLKDEDVLTLFSETRNRVQSIATIHELLYRSSNFASVDLVAYAKQLVPSLVSFYGAHHRIQVHIEGEGARLELERAVPFGLLLNELVSNSLKHGFPEADLGLLSVELQGDSETILLTVKDSGKGLPRDFQPDKQTSLGLKLVHILVKQLGGEIAFHSNSGTSVSVTIPIRPGTQTDENRRSTSVQDIDR